LSEVRGPLPFADCHVGDVVTYETQKVIQ